MQSVMEENRTYRYSERYGHGEDNYAIRGGRAFQRVIVSVDSLTFMAPNFGSFCSYGFIILGQKFIHLGRRKLRFKKIMVMKNKK